MKLPLLKGISLLLLVGSMSFASCIEEKLERPEAIERISSKLKGCECDPYINQYDWKGQTVYVLLFRGPACSWLPSYYGDNGEEITMPQEYSFNTFVKESTFKNTVWTCTGK